MRWWGGFIEDGGRDYRTGKLYLIALSAVFKFAIREGYTVSNPVPEARERILPEYTNTAEARGRDERNRNPLTSAELSDLVPAVLGHGDADVRLLTILLLDAGLRVTTPPAKPGASM